MKKTIKLYIILLFPLILGIAGCTTPGKKITETSSKVTSENDGIPRLLRRDNHTESKQKITTPASAEIQTGRYSSLRSEPSVSQRKLLQVIISVSIPDEITTIGQTIHYLLKRSGYQLVKPQASQPELSAFFYKRLPSVHRRIGPMTLEDALTILTAPAFTLYEDPVQRLISYRLDHQYLGTRL